MAVSSVPESIPRYRVVEDGGALYLFETTDDGTVADGKWVSSTGYVDVERRA